MDRTDAGAHDVWLPPGVVIYTLMLLVDVVGPIQCNHEAMQRSSSNGLMEVVGRSRIVGAKLLKVVPSANSCVGVRFQK